MPVAAVYIKGAADLERKLTSLANSLWDFGDSYEDIGEYWRDQVDMQFALHGAIPGVRGPWRPLAYRTIVKKHSATPLVEKGNLELSYINEFEPYNINTVAAHSARFGSGQQVLNGSDKLVHLAKLHQTGTRYMPARPIVLGNKFLDREIQDSVVNHMFRMWK